MNENEKMVLNEFNTEESLNVSNTEDSGVKAPEHASLRKKTLKIVLCSTLAAAAIACAVTAVILRHNDPNAYDKGSANLSPTATASMWRRWTTA